jgi:glycosyltransferase involved in cell wall biosynthesis
MHAPGDGPRIVVICDYSLGYLGGAQTAMLQEAAALAAAGARVLMLSPSSDRVWQQVRPSADVEHVRVPARLTLPGLELPVVPNTRRLRDRLTRLLATRRIQVVHLQSEFGLAAAAVAAAQRLGLPVVHTVHTFFWQAPAPGQRLLAAGVRRFHRLLTRLPPTTESLAERPGDSALRNMTLTLARQAQLVLSPSAHQAQRLREAGLDRVAVLPNTVAELRDAAPLTAIGPPLKIIWVGRCVPEKRILPFVRAAIAAVDRVGPGKIDFTVVGDGQQLDEARSMAGSRAGISFLGRQDHDHVAELLARSHLAALTSYGFDNQPMTVVEAVMALRGVLYCDPALQEGLDGPGILAPAEETALGDTLVQLASDPRPVVVASQAAVAARAAFTPQHHAAELIMHYRRLIDRGDGTGTR